MPIAIITFNAASVLPVRVEFENSFGNYADLEHAMADIRLFGHAPKFAS